MNRLNQLCQDSAYQYFLSQNIESEKERIYCKHTFEHMIDVARITYILMLENSIFLDWVQQNEFHSMIVGKEVIYTTCILHDIGRWEQYKTGESHALISARYAVGLLQKYNYSPKEIAIITEAIKEHRGSSSPTTVLSQYLQKADKLSRLCFSCLAKETCKNLKTMKTEMSLLY